MKKRIVEIAVKVVVEEDVPILAHPLCDKLDD